MPNLEKYASTVAMAPSGSMLLKNIELVGIWKIGLLFGMN